MTPFEPTTGSDQEAERSSPDSRRRSRRAADVCKAAFDFELSGRRCGTGCGTDTFAQKRTTPGTFRVPVISSGDSRQSARPRRPPEPWNERYAVRTLCRPVSMRANLTASSFACCAAGLEEHAAAFFCRPTAKSRSSDCRQLRAASPGTSLVGLKQSLSIWACIPSSTGLWSVTEIDRNESRGQVDIAFAVGVS